MFITKNPGEPPRNGSFKLGYSRGLPLSMAPKIFDNKKDEEYFITSLYARLLIYNKVRVTGWELAQDDSNKGPDTHIYFEGGSNSIQITRFTLTNYLQRKHAAKKRIDNIVDQIVKTIKVPIPINITVDPPTMNQMPPNKPGLDILLAKQIATLIEQNLPTLITTDKFINHVVEDPQLQRIALFITLQSIPPGMNSNFIGRDNVFINYEFDNIEFNDQDVEEEAKAIFERKNNGQAEILLIWADKFEVLYKPEPVANRLRKHFANSSFAQIVFFSFYNRADMFLDWGLEYMLIKQD